MKRASATPISERVEMSARFVAGQTVAVLNELEVRLDRMPSGRFTTRHPTGQLLKALAH
jgi:hypothetical protein